MKRMQGGIVSDYTSAQGLSNDQVWSLLEDREGNLWIGTRGGGLNCLRNPAILLVSDVLDFSKIEAGKVIVCPEIFSVRQLIDEITATAKPLPAKNHNTLSIINWPNLGKMNADPLRTRQILFNLVSNACKFTERGQIWIESERRTVEDMDWIYFRIKDTGIGITPEQLGRLFTPFTQADASTSRKYGGTGLGLTISQHFCRLMGGEISVTSTPGEGSIFTVRLPADTDLMPTMESPDDISEVLLVPSASGGSQIAERIPNGDSDSP